jgi:protein-S-isoprenylcysteine O-methyltransferase Ste14
MEQLLATRYLLFAILSVVIIAVSWRTLFALKSHGFYRFISWECIAWLFAANYRYWFVDPLGIEQIVSWAFLIVSGYVVVVGVVQLKKAGKPQKTRNEKTLYEFEQTTELVDTGIYKYIRHPLYSSLIFLTWGIFLKNPSLGLLVIALLSTISLYSTALFDEKECITFFGDNYKNYMKRSTRFVPFLF